MKNKAIHFVGIGGIGMSGIAEILLRTGYRVSGSDLHTNVETERLVKLGGRISIGHDAKNVGDAEVVVVSSAISKDNPEILEAKRRGLILLPRAEMLAELMRKKTSIVIAGAHGKTTTSAMVATLLIENGFDPTAVIGGRLRKIASNARIGSDDWFVAESDESDGSFLRLYPTIAVITNIDREHISHYGTFDHLVTAFADFANRVPFDGKVIVCRDDPVAFGILGRIDRPVTTYGLDRESSEVAASDVKLSARGSSFVLVHRGEEKGLVEVPLPGRHNVLNALACASVGIELGLRPAAIAKGLGAFHGIERRLDSKGSVRGIHVIDDYAHHPTEIRATLSAVRLMAEGKALRVLFQPHRYTRLADLWDDFVKAFDTADQVVVVPVYAATEIEIPNITHERLVSEISRRGRTEALAVQSIDEGARLLAKRARKGEILVTMGAGDVTRAGGLILEALSRHLRVAGRKK